MYHIYLDGHIVREIIPDENPVFPGVPIEERYAPDFLARCVAVESLEGIEENMEVTDEMVNSWKKLPGGGRRNLG